MCVNFNAIQVLTLIFILLQFAGLDLQSRNNSGGRYVPPHLRNKLQNQSDNNDSYRGDSRSSRSSFNRSGRDNRDRQGDFSSFNTRYINAITYNFI